MENLLAVLGADSLASALSGAGYDVVSGEARDVADAVRASDRPVSVIVFAGAGPTAGVWARAQTAAGHPVAWLRPTDGPPPPAGALDMCLPAAIGDVLTGLGVPLLDDAVAAAWVLADGTVGAPPRPVQQPSTPAAAGPAPDDVLPARDEAGSDDWWLPADVLSAVDEAPLGPAEPVDEPPDAADDLWGAGSPVEPGDGPREPLEDIWGPGGPPEPGDGPPGVPESLWGASAPSEPPDSLVEPLDDAQAPDTSVEPPGTPIRPLEDLWGTGAPPEPTDEPAPPLEDLWGASAPPEPAQLGPAPAGAPVGLSEDDLWAPVGPSASSVPPSEPVSEPPPDIMEDLWGAPQGPAPQPAPVSEAGRPARRTPEHRTRAKPDRSAPSTRPAPASEEPVRTARQPAGVPRAGVPQPSDGARQWPTTARAHPGADEAISDLWLAGGQPSRRRVPGALAPMAVVLAAKGGVGVTTFAVALAERAATNLGLERVVVVDASGRDGLRPVLWAPEGELPTLYDATIQDDPRVALAMPGALAAARPPGMPTPHFGAVLGAPAGLFLAPFARAKVAQAMTGVLSLAREVSDLVVVDVGTAPSGARGHSAGPNPAQVAPVDVVALLTAPGAWGVGLFDDSRDSFARLAVWWGARQEALAGSHWVIVGNRLSSPPAVDMAAVERFAAGYGAALTSLVADQAGTKRATSTGGWADAPDWLAALDAVLDALGS